MNPHRLLNEVGANYSAYRIRSFVGVLTRHLMEPNKYASWTLLLGLWAPASTEYKSREKSVSVLQIMREIRIMHWNSRALQQVGRKCQSETNCYWRILCSWTGWFTCQQFWNSKLNSPISRSSLLDWTVHIWGNNRPKHSSHLSSQLSSTAC